MTRRRAAGDHRRGWSASAAVIVVAFLAAEAAVAATQPLSPSGTDLPAAVAPATAPILDAKPPTAADRPIQGGNYEDLPLRIGAGAAPTSRPDTEPTIPSFDVQRLVVALAIVVVLAVIVSWVSRRFFAGAAVKPSSRTIQVLSRQVISPKQQLMLVQVGRRIVMIGSTGAQMSALCEISDPDELAELCAQVRSEKSTSISRTFGALFRRQEEKLDAALQPANTAGAADANSTGDSDEAVAADGRALPPELSQTQADLSGLMAKVRVLAQQYDRQTGRS